MSETRLGTEVLTTWALALLALVLALPACKREDPQAAAQAQAAQDAAAEQAAMRVEQQFAAAVAKQDWSLARGYGEVLLMDHPGTKAAARVEAQYRTLE